MWGSKGEKRTAQLLHRSFGGLANVWVFHDLNIPSVQNPEVYEPANIDHAVLTGNHLLLIDTKNWAAGVYWTAPVGGHDMRGLRRFQAAETRTLGMAQDRYRPWLPEQLRIVTITAVWTTKAGLSSLLLLRSRDRVRYMPARRVPLLAAAIFGKPAAPPDGAADRLLAWTRSP